MTERSSYLSLNDSRRRLRLSCSQSLPPSPLSVCSLPDSYSGLPVKAGFGLCVCVVLHSFFSCRAHLVRAGLGFGRHTGRSGAPLLLEGSSPARSRLRCPTETPEVLRSTASQCVAGFLISDRHVLNGSVGDPWNFRRSE